MGKLLEEETTVIRLTGGEASAGVCGEKRRALQRENTACAKGQGWEAKQCALKNWARRPADPSSDPSSPLAESC